MSETTTAAAMPSKAASAPLRQVAKLGDIFDNEEFRKRIGEAVPKQMTPNRMIRSLIGSVRKSPLLMKCSVLDVASKMMICAQAGLETDTPLGHAHLVPFKTMEWNPATRKRDKEVYQCQVIFGYHGLLDLSFRTGFVGAVTARVVWQDEVKANQFSFEYGTDRHLRHRPLGRAHVDDPAAQAAGTAEDPVWVWAHAVLKDGLGDPFEVMPWGEVLAIRNRTPAYRAAQFALQTAQEKGWNAPKTWTEAPWVQWRSRMACKTAFRQLSNWLPRTAELAAAMAIDAAGERDMNLDLGPIIDMDSADYLAAAVDAAGESGDPAATFGVRTGEGDQEAGTTGGGTGAVTTTGPATDAAKTTKPPATQAAKPPRRAKPAQTPPQDDAQPPAGRFADDPPAAEQGAPAGNAAATATAEEEAPEFDHYLLDETGAPSVDDPYDDPVHWAEAFWNLYQRSGNKLGLVEQNADAIADARLTPEAAEMLEPIRAPDQPGQGEAAGAQDEAGEAAVEIPTVQVSVERGKANWGQYIRDLTAAAAPITDDIYLDFFAAQQPVMANAPASSRPLIAKIFGQLAERLGVPPPAVLADYVGGRGKLAAEPGGAAIDKDEAMVARAIEDIGKMTSPHEVRAHSNSPAIVTALRRLEHEGKAVLVQRLRQAVVDRIAALEGKQ